MLGRLIDGQARSRTKTEGLPLRKRGDVGINQPPRLAYLRLQRVLGETSASCGECLVVEVGFRRNLQ